MAYPRKFPTAARRHYDDAVHLFEANRYSNAGYHFGLAAECALKAALISLGDRTIEREGEGRAYWAHFPELKTAAIGLAGRVSTTVVRMLNSPAFMRDWHIKMRYSGDKNVSKELRQTWREQAGEFLAACQATQ